jgi:plasmid stability protein
VARIRDPPLDDASAVVQIAYMGKSASLTIRIPEDLKRRIEAKAAREHRSLSAQVEHELTAVLQHAEAGPPAKPGKLLGRFPGRKIPSDAEFARVRRLLWARLARDLESR